MASSSSSLNTLSRGTNFVSGYCELDWRTDVMPNERGFSKGYIISLLNDGTLPSFAEAGKTYAMLRIPAYIINEFNLLPGLETPSDPELEENKKGYDSSTTKTTSLPAKYYNYSSSQKEEISTLLFTAFSDEKNIQQGILRSVIVLKEKDPRDQMKRWEGSERDGGCCFFRAFIEVDEKDTGYANRGHAYRAALCNGLVNLIKAKQTTFSKRAAGLLKNLEDTVKEYHDARVAQAEAVRKKEVENALEESKSSAVAPPGGASVSSERPLTPVEKIIYDLIGVSCTDEKLKNLIAKSIAPAKYKDYLNDLHLQVELVMHGANMESFITEVTKNLTQLNETPGEAQGKVSPEVFGALAMNVANYKNILLKANKPLYDTTYLECETEETKSTEKETLMVGRAKKLLISSLRVDNSKIKLLKLAPENLAIVEEKEFAVWARMLTKNPDASRIIIKEVCLRLVNKFEKVTDQELAQHVISQIIQGLSAHLSPSLASAAAASRHGTPGHAYVSRPTSPPPSYAMK